MGTNYYLNSDICPHCKRGEDGKHIGKSSAGWHFALHIYPEDGIKTLADWTALFNNPANKIFDEYGKVVTPAEMLSCINDRSWDKNAKPYGYKDWDDFNRQNGAVCGERGLSRHALSDGHCVGYDGMADLLISDFS